MKREELERLLPVVFQRTLASAAPVSHAPGDGGPATDEVEAGLLDAVLDVMVHMIQPVEDAFEELPEDLDPLRARPSFVPYLAQWVDLDLFERDHVDLSGLAALSRIPFIGGTLANVVGTVAAAQDRQAAEELGRLRELISWASYLAKWRGTSKGLRLLLVVATGRAGFVIEEKTRDAHGRVRPFHIRVRAPSAVENDRRLIERIIESQKPAHVTYELCFDSDVAHDEVEETGH